MAELVAACLVDAGIPQLWRGPAVEGPAGIASTALSSDALAAQVADAHGAVGPVPGAALLGGGGPQGEPVLRISARPGARPTPQVVGAADELAAMVRAGVDESSSRPGCVELALAVDLRASAPPGVRPLPAGRPALAVRLEVGDVEGPVVVLVGGGALRCGAVADLRRLADHAGLGVLNTWTAKGVLPWTDDHHLATVGLQAWDFELAGLTEVGLVVACGVDPAEVPRYRWALTEVVDVAPWELGQVAERWSAPPRVVPPRPPLFARLAEALGPHYRGEVAASPASSVMAVKAAIPSGGLVAADPGPAGLWVARTFPTEEPGTVAVPAVGSEGFAVAAALAAAVMGRPAVAVTTEPAGPVTKQLREEAARLHVPLDVRVWGPSTGVDFSHTRLLEEIAGPVVAWT